MVAKGGLLFKMFKYIKNVVFYKTKQGQKLRYKHSKRGNKIEKVVTDDR
jgi:hypothetical protein